MIARRPLILVEQYYYPDGWGGAQIPLDISVDLANSGYSVSVICGRDQYVPLTSEWRHDPERDPRAHGVSIWYVPRISHYKGRTKSIVSQGWFSLVAIALVALRGRRSVLMVQTNPPLIVVAAGVMRVLLGRPLILIAQDIYPEVMLAHGMIRRESATARLLFAVFRWAYRRADCVVSLGPTMTLRLKEKGVSASRLMEIPNWATGDQHLVRGPLNRLKGEWGLSDNFVLLYSGNLGVAHDAETVMRAVAATRVFLPKIRLVVIGDGSRVPEARQMVQMLGLTDCVMFKRFVPDHLLPLSLGVADIALVTLLPGFEGLVVPSKLLGYMARGVPTAYVGPKNSDIAELISRSGCGVAVENGKWDQLAARLIELAAEPSTLEQMRASGIDYYQQHMARDLGLGKYRDLVASVAKRECLC